MLTLTDVRSTGAVKRTVIAASTGTSSLPLAGVIEVTDSELPGAAVVPVVKVAVAGDTVFPARSATFAILTV